MNENSVEPMVTLPRKDLQFIRDWLGDMIDNAEIDALNEDELEGRVASANEARILADSYLAEAT